MDKLLEEDHAMTNPISCDDANNERSSPEKDVEFPIRAEAKMKGKRR
jgi:hypothetical protein